MAYQSTTVSVVKSQDGIRRLIMARAGSKVAFISDPPREGFEAIVQIDGVPYRVRIMATVKEALLTKKFRNRHFGERMTTERFKQQWIESEARRIWRVLFYHLKSVFEASDSGVMEFRELILPYIVMKNGGTVADSLVPRLTELIQMDSGRLLMSGERI